MRPAGAASVLVDERKAETFRLRLWPVAPAIGGASLGVRLRVALDLLVELESLGVALIPRGGESRLTAASVFLDASGRAFLHGRGDETGALELLSDILQPDGLTSMTGPAGSAEAIANLLEEAHIRRPRVSVDELRRSLEEICLGLVARRDEVRSHFGPRDGDGATARSPRPETPVFGTPRWAPANYPWPSAKPPADDGGLPKVIVARDRSRLARTTPSLRKSGAAPWSGKTRHRGFPDSPLSLSVATGSLALEVIMRAREKRLARRRAWVIGVCAVIVASALLLCQALRGGGWPH